VNFHLLYPEKKSDRHALIVAGGSGSRIGGELPKQFQLLNGFPVIMYSVNTFLKVLPPENICIVVNSEMKSYWNTLVENDELKQRCKVADGGIERFYSVRSGLHSLPDEGFVAVHDAARPFMNIRLIEEGFRLLEQYPAIIPVVKIKDSLRQIHDKGSDTVDRKLYRLVQTPQFFHLSLLKSAYLACYCDEFTDDASVVDAHGIEIHMIEGESFNIKITTREDIAIAEGLLQSFNSPVFPL
jgi:2-C-methyl-D-erythritol 4-phosphate cytidylyltransferase